MTTRHKLKVSPGNALKAAIIRRYGTIGAFARANGHRVSTVYAALKFRRSGPLSRAIRGAASK